MGGARFAPRAETATRSPGVTETTMTQEQKIIRAKVGLLELAKQLGNVSQAWRHGRDPTISICRR